MFITLTLEGPAPLLVKLPEPLLTADANVAWARAAGGSGRAHADRKRSASGGARCTGSNRGTRAARLVVSFNPVTVNDRSVTWPSVPVTVTKTVGDTIKRLRLSAQKTRRT